MVLMIIAKIIVLNHALPKSSTCSVMLIDSKSREEL